MDIIKQSERFLTLLNKFGVNKITDNSKTFRVIKRPKSYACASRRIPLTKNICRKVNPILKPTPSRRIPLTKNKCRKVNPILKPTPINFDGRLDFVLNTSLNKSAFVPVRSPMKPKDFAQSIAMLRNVRPNIRSLNFDTNEKRRPELHERFMHPNASTSRDSGFERSNSSYHSGPSFSKIPTSDAPTSSELKSYQPQIPKVSGLHRSMISRPPHAEEASRKEEIEFFRVLRHFTDNNMFTAYEIVFHLIKLQYRIIRKMNRVPRSHRIYHSSTTPSHDSAHQMFMLRTSF